MDNLTHSLVGGLIGQAGLKRKTGLAVPALIIGANIPDIDAGCLLLGGMHHLGLRRGLTHGPVAWIVLPLVLAVILYAYDRWQGKRGRRPAGRLPVHFGWLFALAFIGCLSHPALDWLNNYGVRLLEPFSHHWFYGDAIYIIDIWLWLGLGLATWLSVRAERRGGNWRRPARWALAGGFAYMLANIGISALAVSDIPRSGPDGQIAVASPVAIVPWRRDIATGRPNDWQVREWSAFSGLGPARPVADQPCAWPDVERLKQRQPDLAAFLFWSRMPFVERHGDGIAFGDARYAGGAVRSRFSVAVPGVPCE